MPKILIMNNVRSDLVDNHVTGFLYAIYDNIVDRVALLRREDDLEERFLESNTDHIHAEIIARIEKDRGSLIRLEREEDILIQNVQNILKKIVAARKITPEINTLIDSQSKWLIGIL